MTETGYVCCICGNNLVALPTSMLFRGKVVHVCSKCTDSAILHYLLTVARV